MCAKLCDVQNGVDSVVEALTTLKSACRSAKANGRPSVVLPGTAKAVTVTLMNSLGSWCCVHAALQCLQAVLNCTSKVAAAMRHEGGVKACVAVLKRYGKKAIAVQSACRILARGLSCSALTSAVLHKVRS